MLKNIHVRAIVYLNTINSWCGVVWCGTVRYGTVRDMVHGGVVMARRSVCEHCGVYIVNRVHGELIMRQQLW